MHGGDAGITISQCICTRLADVEADQWWLLWMNNSANWEEMRVALWVEMVLMKCTISDFVYEWSLSISTMNLY